MKLDLNDFIAGFSTYFPNSNNLLPWEITANIGRILEEIHRGLSPDFIIKEGIAIHPSATIEHGAVLKAPIVIGAHSFIAAHAYLRGGVYIGEKCTVGPGSEIKSSIIVNHSALAHFNFVGDSIVGQHVNMEAGAIIANHYNERPDKRIWVRHNSQTIDTRTEKFGAVIGDGSKIGANSVLSPGSLLAPATVVGRLTLYENSQARSLG